MWGGLQFPEVRLEHWCVSPWSLHIRALQCVQQSCSPAPALSSRWEVFPFASGRVCICQAAVEGDLGPAPADVCLVLGETLWNHPSSFRGNASILSPLIQVPDLDADGTPDLLVLTQEDKEVQLLPPPPQVPAAHAPRASLLCSLVLPLPRQILGRSPVRGLSQGSVPWHLQTQHTGQLCPCS